MKEALACGNHLRWSRCRVLEGREASFVELQRTLWRPAMQKTPGMLGGCFARGISDPRDFLVVTFWESERHPRDYVQESLPILKAEARHESDLDALDGGSFSIESSWRVVPD